jgi:hypothetical protein
VISAAVPVRKISSARYSSSRGIACSRTSKPSDSLQDGVHDRRRVDHAVADQEQVLAGAFAHRAVDAETDAFREPKPLRFHADQLARQVVAGCLAERRDRVRRQSLPRRHAHVDAVLQTLGAEVSAPLERGDHRFDGRHDFGRHADLAVAAKRERAQVCAAIQRIRDDDLLARRVDLFRREGNVDAVDLG